MSRSTDAPGPSWGPGFLRLNSWPYRLEYALATVAILVLLFAWNPWRGAPLTWTAVGLAVFWFFWPDIAAFVPIGVGSRGSKSWPSWGPLLYDVFHSLAAWSAVFVVWSVAAGAIPWPLLGWAGHITMDRAAGYHLRAPDAPPPRDAPGDTRG